MRFWIVIVLMTVAGFCGRTNAADPPRLPAAIEWQRKLLDAYSAAVDAKKPLVVLFAHRPSYMSKDGKYHSNEQWVEFDKKEVQALAGKAIFVVCYYDPESNTMLDPVAEVVRAKLKLTDMPTTTVIAPTVDHLAEVYRLEGYFPAAVVAKDLNAHLSDALKPEILAPPASTPEMAFTYLARRVKDGDPDAVRRVLVKKTAETFGDCWAAAAELGNSKRHFLSAIEKRFGAGHVGNLICDDEKAVRRDMMATQLVLEEVIREKDEVLLRVCVTDGNKISRLITLAATKEGTEWKLSGESWFGPLETASPTDRAVAARRASARYDGLTASVLSGRFDSRSEAFETAHLATTKEPRNAR